MKFEFLSWPRFIAENADKFPVYGVCDRCGRITVAIRMGATGIDCDRERCEGFYVAHETRGGA